MGGGRRATERRESVAGSFRYEFKLDSKLLRLHRRSHLPFREYVGDRLRAHMLRAVPIARRRLAQLRATKPEADDGTLERLAARAMVRRLTIYGGVSSVPGLIPFLPVSIPGVIAATVLETSLHIQEQLTYVAMVLLLRDSHLDDHDILEAAVPYLFEKKHLTPERAAASNLRSELGETLLEQAFPIFRRAALIRINSRVAIRVLPLIGLVIGPILSFLQASRFARRTRARLRLGPTSINPIEALVARAADNHTLDADTAWGRALTIQDLAAVPAEAPQAAVEGVEKRPPVTVRPS